MEWIADPSPGGWLRERLDDGYATMHVAVPRGFDELIDAICADPAIEALPVPENADLTWTADGVNR